MGAPVLIENQFATATVANGVTRSFPASSGGGGTITTETNAMRTERTGGVYAGFYVRVTTNTSDGNSTVRFRKNAGNGNQTVTYAAAETGIKQDTTNADNVAVTDTVNFQITNSGGTGSIGINGACCNFVTALGTGTVQHYSFNAVLAATASGLTRYHTIGGDGNTATQADNEIKMGVTGTFKNMGARLSVNTLDVTGSATFTLIKGGSNQTSTVTFASGETGLKEDTTHSDAAVADDLFAVKLVTTGVSGSITTGHAWISLETTNNTTDYVSQAFTTRSAAQTRYINFVGNATANATESSAIMLAQVPMTLTNARGYVSANTWTGNLTVGLRKNTATTLTNTFVFATTVTGWLNDSTHSDTILATDTLCWFETTSAGSGAVTLNNCVVTATFNVPNTDGTRTIMGV